MSYVARKPEPLGTEFKNIVDGVTGMWLWLEIQEGKHRRSSKPFQELDSTSACGMRGVTRVSEFRPFLLKKRYNLTINRIPNKKITCKSS